MNHILKAAIPSWIPHSHKDDLAFAGSETRFMFEDFLSQSEVLGSNPFASVIDFTDAFVNKFADLQSLQDVYIISKEFQVAKAMFYLAY